MPIEDTGRATHPVTMVTLNDGRLFAVADLKGDRPMAWIPHSVAARTTRANDHVLATRLYHRKRPDRRRRTGLHGCDRSPRWLYEVRRSGVRQPVVLHKVGNVKGKEAHRMARSAHSLPLNERRCPPAGTSRDARRTGSSISGPCHLAIAISFAVAENWFSWASWSKTFSFRNDWHATCKRGTWPEASAIAGRDRTHARKLYPPRRRWWSFR